MSTPSLAGGPAGPDALRPLVDTVLDALHEGAAARVGPLPPGGPAAVTAHVRRTLAAAPAPAPAHAAPAGHGTAPPETGAIPRTGTGEHEALTTLTRLLAYGAADPAHPHCAAHLHTPPLALAAAADLAAAALNPSLDSWDQAPAAAALEESVTRALATEAYPTGPDPDALVTTGGTEANQLALLLARERHGRLGATVQTVCGAGTHHSVHRAAWLLGLPEPVTVPAPDGTLDLTALDAVLSGLRGPLLVTATAGTTDTGRIDPLTEIADLCDAHGADLHVDAAYGGPLLFSETRRHLLAGLDRARTVTFDLHKLGWQPLAAGLLAVPDRALLQPLAHTADYLNADDDTEAGLPDLLGRSLRTSRRPDIFKIAVTLRALGRTGLGALVDRVCDLAQHLADLVEKRPRLELHERPALSTVLFRPAGADDTGVAAIRRTLLTEGRAVLGRARGADGRLWLKATLLNPHTTPDDLAQILNLVEGSTTR
ncbi:pyridoxal phosphate-dependent decarboxylase family protein [Streptomyces sp. NPDC051310]|uniref:pyridoxal phosphate-dependent decarboxylase family protein n=1 Tax=Streptomyces sp. NPDC051310 TaxID=3365649 RepID=UPI003791C591